MQFLRYLGSNQSVQLAGKMGLLMMLVHVIFQTLFVRTNHVALVAGQGIPLDVLSIDVIFQVGFSSRGVATLCTLPGFAEFIENGNHIGLHVFCF